MAIEVIDIGSVPNDGTGDTLRAAMGKVNLNFESLDTKVFNVVAYGAVGDGSTDDTAAIQDACDAASVAGGTVYFPATLRYKITAQITVSSTFPVNLVSRMGGQFYESTQGAPGIIIGANLGTDSWIKYTAPNVSLRYQHGAGVIRGLAFIDETWSSADPGTYTCSAVLDLNDFALGLVEGCYFHGVAGSAIKGEFTVMSSIRGNHIRYCGGTSKPGIYLPSTDSTYPAQAMSIDGNRIEVYHGAAYIQTGANSSQLKFISNGFEAHTVETDTSQTFIHLYGTGHTVVGNHFNRNDANQLIVAGNSCTITGNNFEGGPAASTFAAPVIISGNFNTFADNTHRSARTGVEITVSGSVNVLSNNNLAFCGGIRLTGSNNTVSGNSLYQLFATSAGLGAGDDFWICENGSVSGNKIHGNHLVNTGGSVTTVGGVKVVGTAPSVQGNDFRGFAGASNGAICIRCETSDAHISGNSEAGSTTFLSTTSYAIAYSDNFQIGSSDKFLEASETYNPASLADGAGTTTETITVTGAVGGDFVDISFSNSLGGVHLFGWVSAADTVSYRFQNETGSTQDLAEGTVKVQVRKR